jgi:hypothetical protein
MYTPDAIEKCTAHSIHVRAFRAMLSRCYEDKRVLSCTVFSGVVLVRITTLGVQSSPRINTIKSDGKLHRRLHVACKRRVDLSF